MSRYRADTVVMDRQIARLLRARGVRGFLQRSFREDGLALPAALAEWCDALDMYATEIGNVGNAGSPPRSPAVTVSVNEAARELQLSDRRVRQLLREGRLTGRRSHGTYKIDAASVIEEANRRGLE